MTKAIALYSGGLDSTLAILVAMKQGIEVTAVTFLNHFGCDISDRSSCSKDPFSAALKFGFEVKLCHLADKFLDIVKNPKYGHGKNMNPCVDCRILMLKEAKQLAAMRGADVIITGEVLGQRPMSQRRDSFPVIDREAGVAGYVLRPLSAKLLKPTRPEEQGIVDRERLYGLHGRSRKPQIALAAEFGLTDYPAPAGGCLLTDPIYSYRLRELLDRNPAPSLKDISLLRSGRHFRTESGCKIVIGRDERENDYIQSLQDSDDVMMFVDGYGSPLVVLRGDVAEDDILLAASMCARYSTARRLAEVDVTVSRKGQVSIVRVSPATEDLLKTYRIEPDEEAGKKTSRRS